MEAELLKELQARRVRARRCGVLWLSARLLVKKHYPEDGGKFKGGKSWRKRFLARCNFSTESVHMAEPESAIESTHGSHMPWDYPNVDQVSLAFTNSHDATFSARCSKSVSINAGNGTKRQSTIKLMFRPCPVVYCVTIAPILAPKPDG